MKDWLLRDMQVARLDIAAAYLFGSSIRPELNELKPRDIDIVIITMGEAGGSSWQRAIAYRDSLRERFLKAFSFPLSATVVTPSEWAELDGIVIRERVSIFWAILNDQRVREAGKDDWKSPDGDNFRFNFEGDERVDDPVFFSGGFLNLESGIIYIPRRRPALGEVHDLHRNLSTTLTRRS